MHKLIQNPDGLDKVMEIKNGVPQNIMYNSIGASHDKLLIKLYTYHMHNIRQIFLLCTQRIKIMYMVHDI